jgi:hypothetical protein
MNGGGGWLVNIEREREIQFFKGLSRFFALKLKSSKWMDDSFLRGSVSFPITNKLSEKM